ncbi:MAG: Pr6Pr family membrane protein [Aerococcaceae bacterium]|nr:Pr6Pr family membrane protein [Aerococcaceae bacterium]
MKKLTLYRLLIVLLGVIGLISQMYPSDFYKLTYYTTQSNLMVAIFFGYTVYLMLQSKDTILQSARFLRLKGGVTLMITLTFLVYAIMLAPQVEPKDFYTIHNFTLHYAVPILVILDWLLFDKGYAYRWSTPLYWTIVPLAYLAFSLVKGYVLQIPIPDEKHSPYPYFFLNVGKYGWGPVVQYILALSAAYIVFGYLMLAFKKIQHRYSNR